MLSFKGIDPVVLIHGLYHGTRALGLGALHDRPNLTIPELRLALASESRYDFDYLFGRPLKIVLDLKDETFDPRWYDRDAGEGTAERVVERLRAEVK